MKYTICLLLTLLSIVVGHNWLISPEPGTEGAYEIPNSNTYCDPDVTKKVTYVPIGSVLNVTFTYVYILEKTLFLERDSIRAYSGLYGDYWPSLHKKSNVIYNFWDLAYITTNSLRESH
jgi:hypothetical protein